MKQPVKKRAKPVQIPVAGTETPSPPPKSDASPRKTPKTSENVADDVKDRPKYGTSKLERLFASEFLDKLGLKYIYQYEAKAIGRFFDFAVTVHTEIEYPMEVKDGINSVVQGGKLFQLTFIVEIDGDYYHFNPQTNEGKAMNGMQRRNRRVDRLKDEWCGLNCIPLLRIWENDIRKNPQKVFERLAEYSGRRKKTVPICESSEKNC